MKRTGSTGRWLLAATIPLTLSGCLSLSFGGKHEHVAVEPGTTAAALTQIAAQNRIEELEARIRSLEEQLKRSPCSGSTSTDTPPQEEAATSEQHLLAPEQTP